MSASDDVVEVIGSSAVRVRSPGSGRIAHTPGTVVFDSTGSRVTHTGAGDEETDRELVGGAVNAQLGRAGLPAIEIGSTHDAVAFTKWITTLPDIGIDDPIASVKCAACRMGAGILIDCTGCR